jgi:hypothetical protein
MQTAIKEKERRALRMVLGAHCHQTQRAFIETDITKNDEFVARR